MDGFHSCGDEKTENALKEIWSRARIRAFAHQFAEQKMRNKARWLLFWEVVLTIASIACLVVGYVFLQSKTARAIDIPLWADAKPTLADLMGQGFLLISVLLSLLATIVMLTSDRDGLVALQSRHRMKVRMFMNISQKTRRMEAHVYDMEYYKHLISFLNDQIEALVTAGENPDDSDYEKAHRRFNKIKGSKDKVVSSSFVPGIQPDRDD